MQNCCLVRWKIYLLVNVLRVVHLRIFKSHAFSTSVSISQSYRHVLTVSCRRSWKVTYYIDQIVRVSKGYLTLAHCLQVGVVLLTVMWCYYTYLVFSRKGKSYMHRHFNLVLKRCGYNWRDSPDFDMIRVTSRWWSQSSFILTNLLSVIEHTTS